MSLTQRLLLGTGSVASEIVLPEELIVHGRRHASGIHIDATFRLLPNGSTFIGKTEIVAGGVQPAHTQYRTYAGRWLRTGSYYDPSEYRIRSTFIEGGGSMGGVMTIQPTDGVWLPVSPQRGWEADVPSTSPGGGRWLFKIEFALAFALHTSLHTSLLQVQVNG